MQNNKKYWLRGGIGLLLIYGLITAILYPFGIGHAQLYPYWKHLIILGKIPASLVFNSDVDKISWVYSVITYFILGSVFGLIYGKIKIKNRSV